jgi:hypothetical protein
VIALALRNITIIETIERIERTIMDNPIPDLDLENSYVVIDIHPTDFFFQYKEYMVGKTIRFSYARRNRRAGEDYFYGHATFDKPFEADGAFFNEVIFYGVQVNKWTIY